jgi:hypothetical protein
MRVSISLTSQSTGRSHRLKDARFPQFSGAALKEGAARKSVPPRAASGGRSAILDPMLDLPVAGLRHQDEGVHDMAHNNLTLVAQLSGLRILVLANRLGCDTELAHAVHDRLAAKLAGMIEAQRRILAAYRALAAARGIEDEEDAFYDLHHYQTAWYETWLIEAIALLDDYLVDELTNEYFNFHSGRWHHRDGEVPIAVPVPADKLCGLAEIIAGIEDISGARFSVDNVYYSEAEAEAAWWESTGANPDEVFALLEAGRS